MRNEENMFYIYRIVNTINGHDYIGKRKAPKALSPLRDNCVGSVPLLKRLFKNMENKILKKKSWNQI